MDLKRAKLSRLEYELKEAESVHWWLQSKGLGVPPELPTMVVTLRGEAQRLRRRIDKYEKLVQQQNKDKRGE